MLVLFAMLDLCMNLFLECRDYLLPGKYSQLSKCLSIWAAAAMSDVNHLLQVKSVKPCLKQLQQCIQTISTLHDDEILPSNPADLFHWLPKEHMCVLVYLVRSSFLLNVYC